ncbi:hypothetical protein [Microbulbifer sediminum]|uniref:hypothetical protein n=1 Tax=Microbulbifer sediminum TaxID=2904250 RepID=UPI001F3F1E01|nr:hypothetical protein [Microbulbifer sediminum]
MRLVVALSCLVCALPLAVVGQESIQNLPSGAEELTARGPTCYYAGGYFYRQEDRVDSEDFLRVKPPPYNWRNYYRDHEAPLVPVYPKAAPRNWPASILIPGT